MTEIDKIKTISNDLILLTDIRVWDQRYQERIMGHIKQLNCLMELFVQKLLHSSHIVYYLVTYDIFNVKVNTVS